MPQITRLSPTELRKILAGCVVDVKARVGPSVESLDLVFDDGTTVEIFASKGTQGTMGLGVSRRREGGDGGKNA